jgi:hypothetical protein
MASNCIENNPARAVEDFVAARRGGLVPLTRWAKEIGRTTSTLWRWRSTGWLVTVNVAGKLYLTVEEIERFNARAAAGEFSREPVVPVREKVTA